MEKEYIVAWDRQRTDFVVGMVGTAQDFKEYFDEYAQLDLSEEDYKIFRKLNDEDIIRLIDELWDIEIEAYTGTEDQEELHKRFIEKYN
jgi:hypothetical protein